MTCGACTAWGCPRRGVCHFLEVFKLRCLLDGIYIWASHSLKLHVALSQHSVTLANLGVNLYWHNGFPALGFSWVISSHSSWVSQLVFASGLRAGFCHQPISFPKYDFSTPARIYWETYVAEAGGDVLFT